ncbi:Cellulose_synt domain-containing protein [Cephalotus follicularis]|uniref:Cellulose_synt domain-containing protein n=1 Tax=Cephalotus follicularis TaxID=3775 RepID=A0A1Q3BLS6_CEPFO|nr:Cellulose_synt domain-containing protein [Cephalotus follicularis]
MEGLRGFPTSQTTNPPPLHTLEPLPRIAANRAFAVVYTCAILALLYNHAQRLVLLHYPFTTIVSLLLLISDLVLAFMWTTIQSFRMRPVKRREFPENLEKVMKREDYPALDIFICTADPYKEPPISVVNTALSVMAYDYPTEKISVYVSDDGGSMLTLFAFMEAAKFATHWLPFCRNNNILERNPAAYFGSKHALDTETENIKILYQGMKVRVEHVVETGKVNDYINTELGREAFNKWTSYRFTTQEHPTIIQVLLDSSRDKDVAGNLMPNLVYVSREKSRTSPHNFKAGALNALLRVSAVMTNASMILTLDCDMYSNDPHTPLRVLCYLSDPTIRSKYGYIQFPQCFHGINKDDIYDCAYTQMFLINPMGLDGLLGPDYFGTGCFFSRRVFFGDPLTLVSPEISELSPEHVVKKPIQSKAILALAHNVAGCNYEGNTNWGSKIGFRYGSLVEDFYTGYRFHCEGWKSIFCHPDRPAFYGDAPISLLDVLNQTKRWTIGLLEVAFSKYSTITFGTRAMGPLMGLAYSFYSFSPILSIPLTTYAFLPQLALLNGVSIFPKVSELWFYLYVFLFVGANAQDLFEFVSAGGTFQMWWNNQRMWMIRGLSCFLFGFMEYLLKSLGISTLGFNVTNKTIDDKQSKRYHKGDFEFGVASPIFVPLTMAAIINLFSFIWGSIEILRGRNMDQLFLQMLIAGFVTVNCLPIYKAMVLRSDEGKMPIKITITATILACALCTTVSLIL